MWSGEIVAGVILNRRADADTGDCEGLPLPECRIPFYLGSAHVVYIDSRPHIEIVGEPPESLRLGADGKFGIFGLVRLLGAVFIPDSPELGREMHKVKVVVEPCASGARDGVTGKSDREEKRGGYIPRRWRHWKGYKANPMDWYGR